MRERTKVSHRELPAEKRDDVVEKSGRGCRENNIVDVKKKIGRVVCGFVNKK